MYKHLGDNNFVCSDYFIPATYISEQGKEQPCFYCTEMGCDMVANKQNGERGTIFTAQYVRAFHAMRDELARRRERGAAQGAQAVDILTSAELEVYQRKEAAITVLLDADLCYDGIKAALAGAGVNNTHE